MKNVILVSFISILFIALFAQPIYADDDLLSIIKGAENFVTQPYKNPKDIQEATDIISKAEPVSVSMSSIFIFIGTIVAVIYASVLGIRFMLGSVEEKAEIKESLIPFIVGCVIVFGGFVLWKIIIEIGKSL